MAGSTQTWDRGLESTGILGQIDGMEATEHLKQAAAAARAAGHVLARSSAATRNAALAAMAGGLGEVPALPDPLGRTLADWTRPNGLRIQRIATPIGVIGMIYESRPNVGADAAGICLKSGNAIILRGGSESARSAAAINAALVAGLHAVGL